MGSKNYVQTIVIIALAIVGLWAVVSALGLTDTIAEAVGLTTLPTLGGVMLFYVIGTIFAAAGGLYVLNVSPNNAKEWIIAIVIFGIAAASFYWGPSIVAGEELQFAIMSVMP